MALLTLLNFSSYKTIFNQEKLIKPIVIVNDVVSRIRKYPNFIFLFKRLCKYDDITFIHSVNVSFLTVLIAQEMGYGEKCLKEIAWGAFLHDLGKLNVPKNILNKPGKLTDDEYRLIKKHPEYGMELIEPFNFFVNIQMAVVQHHERWGGIGYPLGLREEEIHPYAQIVAVADVFDALISDRPYRKGMEVYQAAEIIKLGKGKDFSPRVVDHLLKLLVM